ncbi:swi5-dependent recombination DNA repair protein 1 homolog [Spea bombifrons]|uniref:swi5-dependent recombination DNA repair protein 1 homolog n=1 Tax=Spea bombifrons TaxID=233779 RepID=UPI00234A2CD6|nr:swi5-dependent recombination DNA repair protein 1 homolog [Spea bombifrons]
MEIPVTGSVPVCMAANYIGSPDPQNNIVNKQPMSASLRERLRKTRRSFISSCSVVKRLKVDCEENEGSNTAQQPYRDSLESPVKTSLPPSPVSSGDAHGPDVRISAESSLQTTAKSLCSNQELVQERDRLLKRVEEKEDILRRLKMVKMYRSKNNVTELHSLIEKWRKSSQLIVYELQTTLSSQNTKISLTQLMDTCGVDDKLLRYNRAEEDFENP